MAQLEIEISGNIPDGTYKTQLIRDSDDTIQFAGLLSYTSGKATATLSTAISGDLITGIVRDGLTPTVSCAGIEGLAVSESLGELYAGLELFNELELHA